MDLVVIEGWWEKSEVKISTHNILERSSNNRTSIELLNFENGKKSSLRTCKVVTENRIILMIFQNQNLRDLTCTVSLQFWGKKFILNPLTLQTCLFLIKKVKL